MRRIITVILCCLCMQSLQAAGRSDFAFGYTLEVDGDGAIYSIELPESLYQGMTRPDRGDVRVFNSGDIAVPHYIRRAELHSEETQPDIELPIFPLYTEVNHVVEQGNYSAHITTNDKGAIIDINYGQVAAGARILKAYLIDTSQLTQAPNALILHWPEGHADFVATVKLEQSDDLSNWRPLVARGTLSNLHYGVHTLIQQRIELPLKQYNYLRMSWQTASAFELTKVVAQFPASYQAQERRWSEFTVTSIDKDKQYYYFDTGAVLPADRLNLSLAQHNTLTNVLIESSHDREGPWRQRYRGLLYDLQFENNQLKQPDILLDVTTHRYWRVRFMNSNAQAGEAVRLRLGWIPEQLLFVAQGEAPFVLAYGSGRVDSVATPLPELLGIAEIKHQKLIKAAHLGSRIKLGDTSKLETPKPPTDWKRYSLWIILVSGVIALAWMALRLYREMGQHQ